MKGKTTNKISRAKAVKQKWRQANSLQAKNRSLGDGKLIDYNMYICIHEYSNRKSIFWQVFSVNYWLCSAKANVLVNLQGLAMIWQDTPYIEQNQNQIIHDG